MTGKAGSNHQGIDIASPKGTAITSRVGGTVVASGSAADFGYSGNYGNIVVVKDSAGRTHLYGHVDKALAKVGSKVKAGELIATVGSTGKSTGPHVHYEVRQNGKTINPKNFLS